MLMVKDIDNHPNCLCESRSLSLSKGRAKHL
jgi:hypothetical protein